MVRVLVLLRSSSPDSQKVSVEESVREGTMACLLDARTSHSPIRSRRHSTVLVTCAADQRRRSGQEGWEGVCYFGEITPQACRILIFSAGQERL